MSQIVQVAGLKLHFYVLPLQVFYGNSAFQRVARKVFPLNSVTSHGYRTSVGCVSIAVKTPPICYFYFEVNCFCILSFADTEIKIEGAN